MIELEFNHVSVLERIVIECLIDDVVFEQLIQVLLVFIFLLFLLEHIESGWVFLLKVSVKHNAKVVIRCFERELVAPVLQIRSSAFQAVHVYLWEWPVIRVGVDVNR